MNKITVIMPAYNSEKYIRESIDSVIHQSYDNWEMIIVNDGSRDSTKEIILQYVQKYPTKVKLIDKVLNEGISKGLNAAINEAEGDYILWLSSDDVYVEEMLQSEIDYLSKNPQYDIIFSDYDIIDPNSNYLAPSPKFNAFTNLLMGDTREPYRYLLTPYCLNGCSVMCKKEHYVRTGGFNPEYKYAHDYDMWVRLATYYNIGYLNKINVHYRRHPEQGTNLGMNEVDLIRALCKFMKTKEFDLLLDKADYPIDSEGRLKVMENMLNRFKNNENELCILKAEAKQYYEESNKFLDNKRTLNLYKKIMKRIDLIQNNAIILLSNFFADNTRDNWQELLCRSENIDGFIVNKDGARFERFTGNDMLRLRKGIKYNNAIVLCRLSRNEIERINYEFGENIKIYVNMDSIKEEYLIGFSEFMLLDEIYGSIFDGKEISIEDKDLWSTITDVLLDHQGFLPEHN